MKKIIAASLTLAFASAAQSAVLLEKVVERTLGGINNPYNPGEPERTVKKTCSIQDDKKMVIKYEIGDLVSSVTYSLQIDKNLITKKIQAVDSEVKANGTDNSYSPDILFSDYQLVASLGSYNAYNKKTKIPLLSVNKPKDSTVSRDVRLF